MFEGREKAALIPAWSQWLPRLPRLPGLHSDEEEEPVLRTPLMKTLPNVNHALPTDPEDTQALVVCRGWRFLVARPSSLLRLLLLTLLPRLPR